MAKLVPAYKHATQVARKRNEALGINTPREQRTMKCPKCKTGIAVLSTLHKQRVYTCQKCHAQMKLSSF